MKIYAKLAEVLHDEGVRQHFTLLGDANMHMAQELSSRGVRSYYVRHEHNACSMAMSFARASGEVGFCSVTCGPGLTQILTALPAAVRAQIPLVIFAGESPRDAAWYNQAIEQGPLVRAAGARYLALHSEKQMVAQLREAFLIARRDQAPVVVGVPLDLQKREFSGEDPGRLGKGTLKTARLGPDPEEIAKAVELVRSSSRIIVLAGRGAALSDAGDECCALARRCGAVLATTLPVRGLFYDDPHYIGIAGGFSRSMAREIFAEADLVIAVGTILAQHTTEAGKLFKKARILHIDANPRGITQSRHLIDASIKGDAKATVQALYTALDSDVIEEDWRHSRLAHQIEAHAASPETPVDDSNFLNPYEVIARLDMLLPKTWEMVNSSGHCSFFAAHMFGRPAHNFHTIREFGAIGNGLAYAMGVAAARSRNKVVLFDGDGSFLMHVQELETIRRHGLGILVCVLNDGAYGSEIHKLRADGLSEEGSVFGRGDLGQIAQGFGLDGHMVSHLDDLERHVQTFADGSGSLVLDIHISDKIMSPVMHRNHPPGKG